MTMRIIVDSSMLDVYGMDGLVFHNGYTFSSPESRGMRLFAEGGEIRIKSLAVYRLTGMDRKSVSSSSGASSPDSEDGRNKMIQSFRNRSGSRRGAYGRACLLWALKRRG